MREILFRGKREDNGEWVEGDLLKYETGEMAILSRFSRYGFEATEIYLRNKVIPETVCQYTGLTDKNGRKIFEGDIVLLTDESNIGRDEWKAKVVFGNPKGEYGCGWNLVPITPCYFNTDILLWVDMEETGAFCEVIGNIYDNPEQLEAKQNV